MGLSGFVLVALIQPFSRRQQDQRHIPHFEANPRENGESNMFLPLISFCFSDQTKLPFEQNIVFNNKLVRSQIL